MHNAATSRISSPTSRYNGNARVVHQPRLDQYQREPQSQYEKKRGEAEMRAGDEARRDEPRKLYRRRRYGAQDFIENIVLALRTREHEQHALPEQGQARDF